MISYWPLARRRSAMHVGRSGSEPLNRRRTFDFEMFKTFFLWLAYMYNNMYICTHMFGPG